MSKPDATFLRAMEAQADDACLVADRAEWLVELNSWLRNPNGRHSVVTEFPAQSTPDEITS